MIIALDTEFYEDGVTITPLTIGMIKENGDALYIELDTIATTKIPKDHFVAKHVIPHLDLTNMKTKTEAKELILNFCGKKPNFVGWCCHYDMVLLQQLWGDFDAQQLTDIRHWNFHITDLRALKYYIKGAQHTQPEPAKIQHHALHDAKAILDYYFWLMMQNNA